MKKLAPIVISLLMIFILVSCEDTTTNPGPVTTKGSISLTSSPTGAAVYVNGTNTGKVTPAVVSDLDSGTVTVKLTLTGYLDTTFTMQVTPNYETPKHVVMTQNPPDLQSYTNIKLYERASNNLSGLDLSTGTKTSSSAAETDIYYEGVISNATVIRSQHLRVPIPTVLRTTWFYNTSGTNLEDGTDSPVYTTGSTWTNEMSGSTYRFLFDSDSHYSKIIITDSGQDGPFDNWVIIDYIYNNLQNDVRF